MQAKMGGGTQLLRGDLFQIRAEITDLRKFAVLNYVAVIKAVKKRNRHLGAKVSKAFVQMRAMDVLSMQYFYTSPKLARLATQAEILSQVYPSRGCSISVSLRHELHGPTSRSLQSLQKTLFRQPAVSRCVVELSGSAHVSPADVFPSRA